MVCQMNAPCLGDYFIIEDGSRPHINVAGIVETGRSDSNDGESCPVEMSYGADYLDRLPP